MRPVGRLGDIVKKRRSRNDVLEKKHTDIYRPPLNRIWKINTVRLQRLLRHLLNQMSALRKIKEQMQKS